MQRLKIRSHSLMSPIGTVGDASSWCYTIHYLARAFIKMGHDVNLITTNGVSGVPKDLLKNFKECVNPDLELVYCTPNNYPSRFLGVNAITKRAKIRFGILNYESSHIPKSWIDYIKYVDYVLPSSSAVADTFLRAGVPGEKIVVLPLGVDFATLDGKLDNFKLKTNKKIKILNVSIPHLRKGFEALFQAYFNEFDVEDDVCLVIKTKLRNLNSPQKQIFEVDVMEEYSKARAASPKKEKLPEVEFVDFRFENMATLYKQCDAVINTSVFEGWALPILEMGYCGGLVAAPRYSGQLDYLEHNKNALLIDVIESRALEGHQYWEANQNAVVGYPVIRSIQNTMRNIYDNHEELHNKFDENMKKTVIKYTWDNSAKIVLDLYDGKLPIKQFGEIL